MATNIHFNVNVESSVAMINKLQQLHKSAFPLAVRETLNDMAFDVKTKTLDQSAQKNFLHRRSQTFFKKFSGVNRATGWNINSMHADVGMTAQGTPRAAPAVSHMQQQEEGGKITTGLDYLRDTRTGKTNSSSVRGNRRWSNQTKLASNNFTWKGKHQLSGGTTKSRMINSMFMAAHTAKVMMIKQANRNLYIQVNSISKYGSGKFTNQFKINSKLLYISRSGGNDPVMATHFSREAAMATVPKTQSFWIKNAQKQITRLWK